MSAVLGTVVVMIVGAIVRDWVARDKALREAAKDTPGMQQAAMIRGERAASRQQWAQDAETRLHEQFARRKIRKPECPTLSAIEQPHVEDSAA